MKLDELKRRYAAAIKKAEAIVKAAESNDDGLLDEQQTLDYEAVIAEADDLRADIDRREKLISHQAAARESNGRQTVPAAPNSGQARDEANGFASIAEFATSVQRAQVGGVVDQRLGQISAATGDNFHREGGSSDGYMVPPQFVQEIWQVVFDAEDLIGRFNPEPTQSNQVIIPVDETTPWGSTGVQANWADEGGAFSESRLASVSRNVNLHKLYAFVTASDELLEDAPRLRNRLTQKAGEAIRYKASDSLIYGTGAGQPLGYFNSDAVISVAKEGGQAADTVQVDNITKMFSRMLAGGLADAFWLVNMDVFPQLASLTIGDQPVFTSPVPGLTAAPNGALLGRPIIFSEHAKTLGDKGDIQFVSPRGYYSTTKTGGLKFASSIHLLFDQGKEAFRWTFRFGGQPYLSAPVSPDNGNNTKSHFVTLDERA
ncbi:MAG: phage major capsid protein [Sphingomonadales bacterium]